MDAGEYDTNTLVINNISSVAFRVYEPIASHTYTFDASAVEETLRNDGHLVYMDGMRRGIWCFYVTTGDPFSFEPEGIGLSTRMVVCGYALGLVFQGTARPIDLLKHRPTDPYTPVFPYPFTQTPNGSSSNSAVGSIPRTAQAVHMSTPIPNLVPPNLNFKAVSSSIAELKGYPLVSAYDIHRFFITSVISSLRTYYCSEVGAITLNQRTVLLPPGALPVDDAHSASAIANFRVYLTTTGSLVITLCVSILTSLMSCTQSLGGLMPGGPMVVTAPFGAFGTVRGVIDADSQAAQNGFIRSPEAQIGNLKSGKSGFSEWKALVSRIMKMHGMDSGSLSGCSWLNIHFQRRPYDKFMPFITGSNAVWPSVLCFRRARPAVIVPAVSERPVFGEMTEQDDVLGSVKSWCQEFPKREEALMHRKMEDDKETDLLREKTDMDGQHPQLNGYSPIDARRPSNGTAMAAAGMMYPTPPDGVQLSGVMPLLDTATSSPANQPSMSALADLDLAIQQDVAMEDNFNDGWDSVEAVETKPEPAAAFPEENIFGDLGEDIFEDNDLTDADFNFFDQDLDGLDAEPPVLPDGVSVMDFHQTAQNEAQEVARVGTGQANHHSGNLHQQPEFTKPELRHARSVLAEESRQPSNTQGFNKNSAIGAKRHPSPFNPETVFKKIRASLQPQPRLSLSLKGLSQRRRSLFEKVDFNPALSLDSQKYQQSGPFKYDRPTLNSYLPNDDPLTTRRSFGSTKQPRHVKELPSDISRLLGFSKKTNGTGNSPARRDGGLSDSDDSSWASDEDNSSDPSGRGTSPAKSGVLKRRQDDDVMSMAVSFKDLDNVPIESLAYRSVTLARLCQDSETSLARWFSEPEPMPLYLSVSDENFITVAQLVTEQAATGFLNVARDRLNHDIRDARRRLAETVRYAVQGLTRAFPARTLAGVSMCSFRDFVELQDTPLLVSPPQPHARVQLRPAEKLNFYPISPPHIELRRNGSQLAMLPSAVSFWDSLGLAPYAGPKDIVSVCVFPDGDGMSENASVFLDRLRSAYGTLKLGSVITLPSSGHIKDGLLPISADQGFLFSGLNMSGAFSSFRDQMVKLAVTLASSAALHKNYVVFFVYEPKNPTSIVTACAAFYELFEHYKRSLVEKKKTTARHELVLQLIPFDYVGSNSSLAVLSSSDCNRLCFETYDRCVLFKENAYARAPFILLEKALPKSLQFEVESTPSPNPLHENSYIHVAYAQSVDERWITAAWTDNQGCMQMTASYCLGRRNRPFTRRVGEIIHEIWESTYNAISASKIHWRLAVTKVGVMDSSETDLWTRLQKAETRFRVSLILITVDTNPSLQLIPPAVRMHPAQTTAAFYTTPVSTPQPLGGVVSPNTSENNPPTPGANAPTPGGPGEGPSSAQTPQPTPAATGDPVYEETLVEITDTVVAIIVGHRFNNSFTLMDLAPTLASGYLLKRCGPRVEDPPALMEMSIVFLDNSLIARTDYIMRDLMGFFRALNSLARVKGVIDKDTDIRPWHVAAVEKAAKVLYHLM